MKIRTFTGLAASLLATAAFGAATHQQPAISMQRARAIALAQAPGTIQSAELEEEKGRLIYSFDIKTAKKAITEVNVDAKNGAIVSAHHESPAQEAAEKKQEAKKKTKG